MPQDTPTSMSRMFIRLFWILFGPPILAMLAYGLAVHKQGWFGPRSIAFLVVLGLLLIVRRFDPETADGEPTTPAHLRKYTLIVLSVGLATWVAAHLAAHYWIDPE
jgi:hypothetical protein